MFTGKRRSHTKHVPFYRVCWPTSGMHLQTYMACLAGKPWCNGILIGVISCVLTV